MSLSTESLNPFSLMMEPERVLQTMQVVQEIEVALGRPPRAGD